MFWRDTAVKAKGDITVMGIVEGARLSAGEIFCCTRACGA